MTKAVREVEALLTVEEAMAKLGLTRAQLYRMIRSGELQSLTIGRSRRIRISAVQAYQAQLKFTDPLGRVVVEGFVPFGHFVYLLWGPDEDRPLYIGQSINVLARLGKHVVASYAKDIRRVTIMRCSAAKEMTDTEAYLIAKHRPLLNVTLNGTDHGAA